MDASEFRGEVIFTFDGDSAGQNAARKAYDEQDQRFTTQTFVAIEPNGLDPCELRMQAGDAAVRDLIANRVPLFEFAIRTTLRRHDLETAEGRVAALAAAAPAVLGIRDRALRGEYGRRLAGWLGMDVETVLADLAGRARRSAAAPVAGTTAPAKSSPPGAVQRPDPSNPSLLVERELLKLALQQPQLLGPRFDALEPDAFCAPAHLLVHQALLAAGGTASGGGESWVASVRDQAGDEVVRSLIAELAVDAPHTAYEPDRRYAAEQLAAVEVAAVSRAIEQLRGRLQRVNPVEHPAEHSKLFGELVALEQFRRGLREQLIGGL
jgi:DNA primase